MFGLGNIGPSGLVLILVALLLLFGPRKLPEIGQGLGKALREFRRTTNGLGADNEEKKTSSESDEKSAKCIEPDPQRGSQE